MPDTTVRGVHVNVALTNLSLGYHPTGMISEQVVNVVPVKNETDFYYVWRKSDAFRRVTTYRADGTQANIVDFGFDRDTYLCEEYALATKITERQARNADLVLNLEMSKTRRLQDLIALDQEKRVADLLTTGANYAAANTVTLSGTNQWNHASFTGSIEQVFDDAKEAIRQGTGGNVQGQIAIIPRPVALVIKRDSQVRDLIKFTENSLLVNGDLPPTIWNLKVVIPTVMEQTAVEIFDTDSSTALTDVWGKHVVITHKPHAPSLDTLAHAYIFRARDWQVTQWKDDSIDTTFYRTGVIQTEKLVCNTAGYLIRAAVS